MDPAQIASILKDYGPWGGLGVSLLVIRYLYGEIVKLQSKAEGYLIEWRKDSQAQGDKLAEYIQEQNDHFPPRKR